MINGEWLIEHGYKFTDLFVTDYGDKAYQISVCGEPIATYHATNEVTYLEIVLKWLDQEHDPVLNNLERKYLSEVIKPFIHDVLYIVKRKVTTQWGETYEYIEGRVRDEFSKDNGSYSFSLPRFKEGTKCKGMEVDKLYSLEDLSL